MTKKKGKISDKNFNQAIQKECKDSINSIFGDKKLNKEHENKNALKIKKTALIKQKAIKGKHTRTKKPDEYEKPTESIYTTEGFRVYSEKALGLGGGYTLGCIGGFVCHFGKSMIHSPFNQKFVNSLYFARTRAPALGGSFAAWGGTFSAYDCLSHKFRKKEDSWNAIYAGAATGGTLALRNGLNAAARQAIIGGIFVSVIEGMIFYFSKRAVMTPRDQYMNTIELEKKLSQNPKSIKKKVLAPFSFLKMSKTESKPK